MEGSKEIFCRMREDVFNEIPSELRIKFNYTEVRESNEYENNKNDVNYLKLYKEQKKAKNNLQEYLFNKRHNIKK